MSIRRLPRVVFSLDPLPARRARAQLVNVLEQQLSKNFGLVRRFKIMLVPVSILKLQVSGRDFVVAIKRLKPNGSGKSEWKVRIDPLKYPAHLRNMPNNEQRQFARDLMLISDAIQAVLINVPGITRLRWYFVGWDVNTPGVLNPADLPWHIDIPELVTAQNRKTS